VISSRDPRLGQVFTPEPVADLALRLAWEGSPRALRLLDPACGDGVFLRRAAALGICGDRVGIELDPVAAKAARAGVSATIVEADFFDRPAPPAGQEFDLVVGNPPYVRQEIVGAEAKRRIAARLAEDWPELGPAMIARLCGRADLAVAFVCRALRFVRPGGRVAFVVSGAMADAGYGDTLREFLDGRAEVRAVVTSPGERWFADAAVFAMILVLERAPKPPAHSSCFARLRHPVAEVAPRVRGIGDLDRVAKVRTVTPSQALSASWGPLLRAPDVWFDVLDRAGSLLVPLRELADLWRGATSGANEFFYLSRTRAEALGLEPDCLAPVFKTPRQQPSIRLRPEALPTLAFVCDDLSSYPGARAYVKAHQELATRPTLAARPKWWFLAARPAQVFLTKAYDARFAQFYSPTPVLCDQRVYALAPRGELDPALLCAVLNGTLTSLALEVLGRQSMGEGALEWSVEDAHALPVLDVRRLTASQRQRVVSALEELWRRPVGPARDEVVAPDRRALDEALLGAAPQLRRALPELGQALASGVACRIRAENTGSQDRRQAAGRTAESAASRKRARMVSRGEGGA
jgi:hypothetical protein